MRSEEDKGLGLEPGPSRLQAVARQQMQGRSAASRGQNMPGRSVGPEPGSARPRLARPASPGSCRFPGPDAGRRRPRPNLASPRPGVCKNSGPTACERNSTSTPPLSWTQRHREIHGDRKPHTHIHAQKSPKLGDTGAHRIIQKLGDTHRYTKVTRRHTYRKGPQTQYRD